MYLKRKSSLYRIRIGLKEYKSEEIQESLVALTLRRVQGNCRFSSPVFFNMHSEELVNKTSQDGSGLDINRMTVNNIWFADEFVLLASSEEGLQRLVNMVSESCIKYDMELNAKKT